MSTLENKTNRLLFFSLLTSAYGLLVYFLSLVLTGFDLLPMLFQSENVFRRTLEVLLGTGIALLIATAVFRVLWLQNEWNERFPGEEDFTVSFWGLSFPVFGQGFLAYLLFNLLKREKKKFLISFFFYIFSTAAAIVFFVLTVFDDSASSPLFMFLFFYAAVVSWISLLILLMKNMRGKWSAAMRRFGYGVAIFAVFTFVFAWLTMFLSDITAERYNRRIRSLDGCVDSSDLERAYFHGMHPDPEWTALVDRLSPEKKAKDGEFLKKNVVFAIQEKGKRSGKDWEIFRKTLASRQKFTDRLDRIFSRAPVKYAINFDMECSWEILLPQMWVLHRSTRLYAARIHLALKDGNRAEVMRLHRLSENLSATASEEVFLVGYLVSLAVEDIRIGILQDMLASHLLTNCDLEKMKSEYRRADADIMKRQRVAFATETIIALDWFRYKLRGGGDVPKCEKKYFVSPFFHPAGAPVYHSLRNTERFLQKNQIEYLERSRTESSETVLRDINRRRKIESGNLSSFVQDTFLTFGSINTKTKAVQSNLRMAQIACEIERFRMKNKRLPDSLADLKMKDMPLDPFSGKPFLFCKGKLEKYRLNKNRDPQKTGTMTGYQLYSVGRNQVDDGGRNPDLNKGDILFQVADPGSFIPEAHSS